MSGPGSIPTTLHQKVLSQIVEETEKTFESAKSQVLPQKKEIPTKKEQEGLKESREEKQIEARSRMLLQKLRAELEEIRREKIFNELSKRVSQGEEINLSLYPNLTIEQRQVLKAQMEAIKRKKEELEKSEQKEDIQEPTTKRPRGLFGAVSRKISDLTRRGEVKDKIRE